MSAAQIQRGGAPIGFVTELDGLEAASVIYLRLWCNGRESQTDIQSDFVYALGQAHGQRALEAFEQLFELCARHGRRPLMHHSVSCKCLGSDEACFANFIASAAEGEREDTLLIATLLVRPDVAPIVASLAAEFGLALKRMQLRAPQDFASGLTPETTNSQTYH